MSIHRRVRSSLLTSAIAVTLLASTGQTGASAADTDMYNDSKSWSSVVEMVWKKKNWMGSQEHFYFWRAS